MGIEGLFSYYINVLTTSMTVELLIKAFAELSGPLLTAPADHYGTSANFAHGPSECPATNAIVFVFWLAAAQRQYYSVLTE